MRACATPVATLISRSLDGGIADGAKIAIQDSGDSRHVHGLFGFPSKFIPEIPNWAIRSFSVPHSTILGPFGGSGTTAVEAVIEDRHAVSVDINPFASLLTRAKTTILPSRVVDGEFAKLNQVLSNRRFLPPAHRLVFPLDDFWFDTAHLIEFAQIKHFIEAEVAPKVQPLLLAILASTIRDFSFQDVGQIKVKRDARKVALGTPSPSTRMQKRLAAALPKYQHFVQKAERSSARVETCTCSVTEYARGAALTAPDLIVTSPPYINAMNYPMAMRYELLLLGLVSPENLVKHQSEYFGTERVYVRDYKTAIPLPTDWSCSEWLDPILAHVYEGEPKRWFIAYSFFCQMREAFISLAELLSAGGTFVLVAGTNTIRNQFIDTFAVLSSFLSDAGLDRVVSFHYELIKQKLKITRHATANLISHDGIGVFKKSA